MSLSEQVKQGTIEEGLLKKERYTGAFMKALPGFYQTLLSHGQWFIHHYTAKGFLFTRKEHFEAVPLLSFNKYEGRYTTGEHYITKDGKYLRNTGSTERPVYEEIDSASLAEGIYRSLDWDDAEPKASGDPEYDEALAALREAMEADDADATVLRYCMLVLRYQYR